MTRPRRRVRGGRAAAGTDTARWVFGIHAVGAALGGGGQPLQLLLAEGRHDQRVRELEADARARDVPVQRVSPQQLDALTDVRHQGVALQLDGAPEVGGEAELEELLQQLTTAPLLLVLDGVTDPRNLGACLRSADAAGAHALIVPRSRTAPLSEAALRTASGAAEHVPVFAVANLARVLRWLAEHGLQRVGLCGDTETCLWDVDLRSGCVLLLGSEDKGLRRLTREHCDALAALPMAGSVESLNVSVAAGVALFEACRQRRDGA